MSKHSILTRKPFIPLGFVLVPVILRRRTAEEVCEYRREYGEETSEKFRFFLYREHYDALLFSGMTEAEIEDYIARPAGEKCQLPKTRSVHHIVPCSYELVGTPLEKPPLYLKRLLACKTNEMNNLILMDNEIHTWLHQLISLQTDIISPSPKQRERKHDTGTPLGPKGEEIRADIDTSAPARWLKEGIDFCSLWPYGQKGRDAMKPREERVILLPVPNPPKDKLPYIHMPLPTERAVINHELEKNAPEILTYFVTLLTLQKRQQQKPPAPQP